MASSDSDDDNLIRYGNALDPYDEGEVPTKKKFQDQAEQHAVDSQGRRRFHGAFTGGFSAGYGNSVGTPEGWAPASFKSSRLEKANSNNQKPEDFMDEEDRSEFGIAPQLIQTRSEFSGQKRPHQSKRFHDGPIPGEPVLEQLLRPVHETVAVKILKAMGWKPGQGIGERLTFKEKNKIKEKQKIYGCYLPPDLRQESQNEVQEDSSNSDSEFDYETLFAPNDYKPYILKRKNDVFGLGYTSLSRHSVLGNLMGEYGSQPSGSNSHLIMKDKGKKVSIRGQAFGVGALEDDDEDIYAKEDMSHYDFTLGDTKEQIKKAKQNQKSNNVLEGFTCASKPLPPRKLYPPPALPRDYVPAPAGARRSRFETTTHVPRDQGLGRHELSAEARGTLLGESPLPKQQIPSPPSVIHDNPLTQLPGRSINFTTNDENSISSQASTDFIPINKADNTSENYNLFKPFASNPQKQSRYEKFLQEGPSLDVDTATDKLTEWEKHREVMEFEQAAKLYKPLSGIMGDRFTHAAEPDDGALNPLCSVAKSANNHGLATEDQIDAAKKGMYGVLTRTQTDWRPESLVCKRFNIPEPYAVKPTSNKNEKLKISYSIFEYLETPVHDKDSFTKEQSKFSGSKSMMSEVLPQPRLEGSNIIPDNKGSVEKNENKRITVAELFMRESENVLKSQDESEREKVTETINSFDKMALYKSIFLSDSESEEESAPQSNKNKESEYKDFMDEPKNIERNNSPPRGIFANIDFDELNSWNRSKETKDKTGDKPSEEKVESIENDGMYGPKLPNALPKLECNRLEEINLTKPAFRAKEDRHIEIVDSSSSSDSWVEATESKSKKQKKKKSKKHKSKHKKHKHKKKNN